MKKQTKRTSATGHIDGSGTTNEHDRPAPREGFTGHFGYLFKVTNRRTGAVFIGEQRIYGWQSWRKNLGTGTYLRGEVEAYGAANFSKEFLEWTSSEVNAKVREGRFISRALTQGLCYNSNNAYSLRRDPVENAHNFAFKASFRSKARLAVLIDELERERAAAAENLTEMLALQELITAHKLALTMKRRRYEATGILDEKDRADAGKEAW